MRNHKTGDNKPVHWSRSIRECEDQMELLAKECFQEKEGAREFRIYPKSLSRKYGKIPAGFFVRKSLGKFPKLTVCEKLSIPGILYSGIMIDKIVSFQIIKIPELMMDDCVYISDVPIQGNDLDSSFCQEHKISGWNLIHNDIRSFEEIKKQKAQLNI